MNRFRNSLVDMLEGNKILKTNTYLDITNAIIMNIERNKSRMPKIIWKKS